MSSEDNCCSQRSIFGYLEGVSLTLIAEFIAFDPFSLFYFSRTCRFLYNSLVVCRNVNCFDDDLERQKLILLAPDNGIYILASAIIRVIRRKMEYLIGKAVDFREKNPPKYDWLFPSSSELTTPSSHSWLNLTAPVAVFFQAMKSCQAVGSVFRTVNTRRGPRTSFSFGACPCYYMSGESLICLSFRMESGHKDFSTLLYSFVDTCGRVTGIPGAVFEIEVIDEMYDWSSSDGATGWELDGNMSRYCDVLGFEGFQLRENEILFQAINERTEYFCNGYALFPCEGRISAPSLGQYLEYFIDPTRVSETCAQEGRFELIRRRVEQLDVN